MRRCFCAQAQINHRAAQTHGAQAGGSQRSRGAGNCRGNQHDRQQCERQPADAVVEEFAPAERDQGDDQNPGQSGFSEREPNPGSECS